MKILFVENRYKTFFWEAIAKRLEDKGYEIHWIIQNHLFVPKTGVCHFLDYPNNSSYSNFEVNLNLSKIIETSRGLRFFGIKKHQFIYSYYKNISILLEEIKPDLVFGESTLVHELLTIEICKNLEIMFLHPTSCRYPKDRLSFYRFDTLVPFGGETIENIDQVIESEISKIKSREIKPNYMYNFKNPEFKKKVTDRVRLILSYFFGERFNTPSPLIKYKLEKSKRARIKEWESISQKFIDKKNGFKILYPLQMQPEANLDIWGYPYYDQAELISFISNNLVEDEILYVKPNPKSKYEITGKLLDIVKKRDNIIPITHRLSMDSIFNRVDCFITVTGTISFEALISEKKALIFGLREFREVINNVYYVEESDFRYKLDYLKITPQSMLPNCSTDILGFLINNSYWGNIGDAYNTPHYFEKENMDRIESAFLNIIRKLEVIK